MGPLHPHVPVLVGGGRPPLVLKRTASLGTRTAPRALRKLRANYASRTRPIPVRLADARGADATGHSRERPLVVPYDASPISSWEESGCGRATTSPRSGLPAASVISVSAWWLGSGRLK